MQHPDCFSAEGQAKAQTLLDQIDDQVSQQQLQRLRDNMHDCVDAETDAYSWSTC